MIKYWLKVSLVASQTSKATTATAHKHPAHPVATLCSRFERSHGSVPCPHSLGKHSHSHLVLFSSGGGCDQRPKCGQEELPHVRGQGKKPEGPHARRVAAKRSYPTSEVRGSGREYQTATAQEWPRGDTQCLRSGAVTRGVTLRLRSGAAAGRSNPTSKEPWLCGRRRA